MINDVPTSLPNQIVGPLKKYTIESFLGGAPSASIHVCTLYVHISICIIYTCDAISCTIICNIPTLVYMYIYSISHFHYIYQDHNTCGVHVSMHIYVHAVYRVCIVYTRMLLSILETLTCVHVHVFQEKSLAFAT